MKRLSLESHPRGILCSGVVEAATAAISADLFSRYRPRCCILLDSSLKRAEQWAEDFAFFHQLQETPTPLQVRLLPTFSSDEEGNDPRTFEILCDRLAAATTLLKAFSDSGGKDPPPLVVLATTPDALLEEAPTPESLQASRRILRSGERHEFQELVRALAEELDYDSEVVCEQPGQFAVRGGLVDVYPLNDYRPYRIDFFGDEVESIRSFDPTTQRSGERVEEVVIASGHPGKEGGREGALLQYLPDEVLWILREPDELERAFPGRFQIPERLKKAPRPHLGEALDRPGGTRDRWVGLAEIDTGNSLFGSPITTIELEADSLANHRQFPADADVGIDRYESEQFARKQFLQTILDWQRAGYAVWIFSNNEGEEGRLKEILQEDPVLRQLEPTYARGALHEGFRLNRGTESWGMAPYPLPADAKGWVVVTDGEIFGRYRRRLARLKTRQLPNRHQVDQLLDFSELADGDPIVHLQHGICLFRGLTRMNMRGREEEVISLEFAEGATLHVPLHESHLLTRYVGLSKRNPKIAKLGSNTWEKTRAAAEKATLDFAAELLNLQARRDSAEGHAFSDSHPWLKEFEDSFIYQETPDQMAAIQATRGDMTRTRPMDRLVCGDVGFGKTEVALRACFQAVLDGKQAALLVPTTVLCQQHFNTFRERMADYPVVVEMVSRFRTPQQNRKILKSVTEGQVDIVIGTHRLLSEDVLFRDLGLLVIDEEQRFGVKQKERLKELKINVDVLAMSATPIPRTLYMALVGARELSVIETPPRDRMPIQTIVKGYSPEIVKGAIQREMARGGQVFYLHNRVQTIQQVAARVESWFPNLRIAVGHGQMDEGMLEHIMTRFVAGEFDILVCTTIIESGIDIPNCNTMIIEGADRFGLSQLYQLRGRVGRFKRQAYCYLLLHRNTHLRDQARKRLSSLRQFNQLGAGFRIAMRDLELRGAGNLLGSEQSGHIAGVGFDLYCQLLRQSVSRLKGEPSAAAIRATVRLDFVQVGVRGDDSFAEEKTFLERRGGYSVLKADELQDEQIQRMAAFIPEAYIEEPRLRVDFYRQLAMVGTLDQARDIRESMQDRFGPLPDGVQALVLLAEIRILAEQKGFALVESEGSRLKLKIARAKGDNFVKVGSRFPRLQRKQPLARLKEIRTYIKRQKTDD